MEELSKIIEDLENKRLGDVEAKLNLKDGIEEEINAKKVELLLCFIHF